MLHDIGIQDGAGYMVMELLEGEALASRIEKGAIPLLKTGNPKYASDWAAAGGCCSIVEQDSSGTNRACSNATNAYALDAAGRWPA